MVSPPLDDLTAVLHGLQARLCKSPSTWTEKREALLTLRTIRSKLPDLLRQLIASQRHPSGDVERKIGSLLLWIDGLMTDLTRLTPWLLNEDGHWLWDETESVKQAPNDARNRLIMAMEGAQSLDQLQRLPQVVAEILIGSDDRIGVHLGEDAFRRRSAALETAIAQGAKAAAALKSRCDSFGHQAEELALRMDFEFLFNPQRRLFAIGFNLEDGQLDRSHYDMLCSEARLSSHLAIAKGDVAYKHWFQLGRQATFTAGQSGLLSWGGTMFEFLMPLLFQRRIANSLLAQACEAAVARQQEYGHQRGVPWGVSESAFAALASNSDYCYQSFGVPGLGLKRGLSDDMVVSPYATMLALPINPTAAIANLRELASENALGTLGFYDAIDYTPNRVPAGRRSVPVRTYMAHHQAMSLTAIANLLLDGITERRFHAHPLIRATEMLLEEAVPTAAPLVQPHQEETLVVPLARPEDVMVSRRLVGFSTTAPQTHLLSNGTYSVLVTNTGGGYSRRGELAVNRWRADPAKDEGGHLIYIRDRRTGRVWSATFYPTCAKPDAYEVLYSIDKAEYRRRDGDIETHLEVAVSPDTNVEVRQLRFTNHGWRPCELEITSAVEVTLATPAADLAHPAFQKLFVETEYIAEETALLAKRRPRESHGQPVWGVHVLARLDAASDDVQYETCRETFLGRGRDSRSPAAMEPGQRLSGTTGAVLDAVLVLRCSVSIGRQATASLAFTTGMADSREDAVRLADQFHEHRNVHRAFELAWVFNQVQLHHQHLTAAHAQRCQKLASYLIFPRSSVRGPDASLRKNRQGQSGLWRFGISGDRPILLVKASETEHLDLVRELLLAQEYWQHHGFDVDLAILNTHPGSYLDELQEQLLRAVQESPRGAADSKKSIFLLRAAQMPQEDQWLLETAAHVVMDARRGWTLGRTEPALPPPGLRTAEFPPRVEAKQARWYEQKKLRPAAAPAANQAASSPAADGRHLEFWNGCGGFADHGREYHIRLSIAAKTPAPWSNVIANPRFGCLITEGGGGYTWAGNSRQNKLTSWSNDPVGDPPSETLYLRDDETREVWLPMAAPRSAADTGWLHHGQGYSRFVRMWNGIGCEVLISIAPDDPVKFLHVTLRNQTAVARRLTTTYFAELVLGVSREQTQMHLISEYDDEHDALLVRNAYNTTFADQIVFLKAVGQQFSVMADRTEFLGRNGSLHQPRGLDRFSLSGATGAGLDPCGAVQTHLTLNAGEQTTVVFLLGCAVDARELNRLLTLYSHADHVHEALAATQDRWESLLTKIQVQTPNRALDLVVNRWLLYQVLSCRVWGRAAFYQCGGAYGFRDQLQDVMAAVYARPDVAREQILRAASRQYETGDVQHWWHPPSGEGTRTRFSDDFLWLPFVVAHYIRVTGEESVLDEVLPYLHSHSLQADEQERYELPQVSLQSGSLLEHCLKALQHGVRRGEHGLPLMGCGDWNDGMNQVGELGRGESVWVGWFLLVLLDRFLPLVERRGDRSTVEHYRQIAKEIRLALEARAWDGRWYRRAFFDDGTPLGSQENDECQIDSIAQSWAVLAHAEADRTASAMDAVFERLVSTEHRLVTLFSPPFDKTALEPGYIKGYLPGVRENGGQYTHAVAWLIQALTVQGDADRAMTLWDFVNPVLHAQSPADVELYRVEPYVIAADVYSVEPHAGRGGWTWYTGSAAWMYRIALESLLGMSIQQNQVSFQPCLPADWGQFKVTLRVGQATWHFTVKLATARGNENNGDHGAEAQQAESAPVTVFDDGQEHFEIYHSPRRPPALFAVRGTHHPEEVRLRAKGM